VCVKVNFNPEQATKLSKGTALLFL